MNNKVISLLAGLLLAMQAQASTPVTLSFYAITGNATAIADGQANLQVQVSDIGSNQARFHFTNNSDSSSLTDVYFADGALLGISSVSFSSGVKFTGGSASPPDLPGGSGVSPAFHTTAGFLADADSPSPKNGVQNSDASGEWLNIDFNLKPGKSFADVVTALTLPTGGEWLRIGVHVQSFADGSSASFINTSFVDTSIPAVPEADASVLLLAGLGLLGAIARRRVRF